MSVSLAIVTPAKNESLNLPHLFESLKSQSAISMIKHWVIVDDNSQDDTFEKSCAFVAPFEITVLKNQSSGSLIKGGAYESWFRGLAELDFKNFSHFMKLDADVILDVNFLRDVFDSNSNASILGGVLIGFTKEQNVHIPGPAKIYRTDFFEHLKTLPCAPGFDVMDEVLAHKLGSNVQVVKSAKFKVRRAIGASEGRLHGRYRNGLICRWTGYNPLYFFLHLVRYFFRTPLILGSFGMLFGYFFAGKSPYSKELRSIHSGMQKGKLVALMKNPVSWIRNVYFS